jgi:hypothetical protein
MTTKNEHSPGRRRTRPGEARAWLDGYLASFDAGAFTTDCVLWPFSVNGGKGGQYPQINIQRRMVSVTHYVFEHVIGQCVPDGEVIRHTCDTPRCINPWHFESGDQIANMRDMVERKRSASGPRNGNVQLTADDVRDIRRLVAEVELRHGDLSFIARSYGVTPTAISLIVKGKTWHGIE